MPNKAKILWTITEPCSNREFPQEQLKNYHALKNCVFLRGLMTLKNMPRNVWNDIVSWQTRRLNNSTKYLLPASMTTTSKKKKWNRQKYALRLFWNAFTWHVLENLTFYGQWTNLHDQLQNGPKPVTNDWIVWYLTSITHVNINSIVMWVILPSDAGWDYFLTPILREILRIQNPLLEEHCAFLGSHTFCSNKLDV